jgi:chaperonin GroEL
MKIILKGKDARASIRNGINLVADCVKITLGPNGRNAILGRISQTPLITNDGVTIADYVEVENETEQLGVKLVKEVSRLTETSSGDGTTTATVLLQALVNKCIDLIDNDESLLKSKRVNPLQIRKEITDACETIVAELKKQAKPITTKEEIRKVAKVSVENDELAELLADIFFSIGKDGVIVVEEGTTKTTHEVVKGLELPSGIISEYITTSDGEFKIENPKILVTTEKISKIDTILPILELLSLKGILKLVIVAKDFDDAVIKIIEKNHIGDVFTILPVKVTDLSKKYQQEDIASLTGAKVVTFKEPVNIEDLGTCESITANKDKTMFIGGNIDEEYVKKLKKELNKATSDFDKEGIERRVSSLSGGIAS